MPGPGRPYRLKKAQSISYQRLSVEGGRSILAYKELAKRTAQGELTKMLRGHRQILAGIDDGEALKDSVTAMAETLGANDEQMAKISEMDGATLSKMYNSNKLTFEVYFNYEGIRETAAGESANSGRGSWFVTEDKTKDLDWFINEYERFSQAGL